MDGIFGFISILMTAYELCANFDLPSSFRKLECIALQVHEHLLDPHRISLDHIVEVLTIQPLRKPCKTGQHLNILRISLVLLNLIDLFNRLLNIELLDYLVELVCFDLGIP